MFAGSHSVYLNQRRTLKVQFVNILEWDVYRLKWKDNVATCQNCKTPNFYINIPDFDNSQRRLGTGTPAPGLSSTALEPQRQKTGVRLIPFPFTLGHGQLRRSALFPDSGHKENGESSGIRRGMDCWAPRKNQQWSLGISEARILVGTQNACNGVTRTRG